MSRIYRTQKEYEVFLIRNFLKCLGYRITNLRLTERPDVILTINKGKNKKRIGIEHTDYYNDTKHGITSKITYIDEFWRLVQSSLARRISHRKYLGNILANVTFKGNISIPRERHIHNNEALEVAKELVSFAMQNPPSIGKWITTKKFTSQYFPKLNLYLSRIELCKRHGSSAYTHCTWSCNNITGGYIGLVIEHVKSAIVNKNKKAINYSWGNVDEKWLLIAASGTNIGTQAGPKFQKEKLTQPDLIKECSSSIFDRIYFFEYCRGWYRKIWPS